MGKLEESQLCRQTQGSSLAPREENKEIRKKKRRLQCFVQNAVQWKRLTKTSRSSQLTTIPTVNFACRRRARTVGGTVSKASQASESVRTRIGSRLRCGSNGKATKRPPGKLSVASWKTPLPWLNATYSKTLSNPSMNCKTSSKRSNWSRKGIRQKPTRRASLNHKCAQIPQALKFIRSKICSTTNPQHKY